MEVSVTVTIPTGPILHGLAVQNRPKCNVSSTDIRDPCLSSI